MDAMSSNLSGTILYHTCCHGAMRARSVAHKSSNGCKCVVVKDLSHSHLSRPVCVCVSTASSVDQQKSTCGALCHCAGPGPWQAPKCQCGSQKHLHYCMCRLFSVSGAPVSRLGVMAISLVADC